MEEKGECLALQGAMTGERLPSRKSGLRERSKFPEQEGGKGQGHRGGEKENYDRREGGARWPWGDQGDLDHIWRQDPGIIH